MQKSFVTLLAFLFFTVHVNPAAASYTVGAYDPNYTPYNLQAAIDHGNCEAELEEFDSKYQEIRQRYIDYMEADPAPGQSAGQASRMAANLLNEIEKDFQLNDFEAENAIADCLDNEPTKAEVDAAEERNRQRELDREEDIRMALASCDIDVLEDLTDNEARQYEDDLEPCLAERKEEILAAVEICDFDFFEDEMTRKERNTWFVERTECEENPPKEESTTEVAETLQTAVPEPVNVEPAVPEYVPPEPRPSPEPVETNNVQPAPIPTMEEESDVQERAATSSMATATADTIEVTQEELDKMVEEKINEKLNQVESDPEPVEEVDIKPSFFKRVTNFLFGWMF